MAEFYELTQMRYSDDRKGPFRLYLYNGDGYHRGGHWFRSNPRYPEEISVHAARVLTETAIKQKREVRICDGSDFLVFHAVKGRVLFPIGGQADRFWDEVIRQGGGKS